MTKELLIEAGAQETRVAVLEEGRVVEVQIERSGDPGVVGNLYKGRVSRVVPGIQAAFVDLGLERDAFLFAGDLKREGLGETEGESPEGVRPQPRPISDHVKQGQELLVQVVKEPLPGKGARISSQISLPGRFVVLLPGAGGVGVSRRITAPEERQRLESLLGTLVAQGHGVIARTAAESRSQDELRRDLRVLMKEWQRVVDHAVGVQVPGLVRQETSLAERAARDLLDDDVKEIWVEGAETASHLVGYLSNLDPEQAANLRAYEEKGSLFEHRGVDAAIAKAMRSKVWLKSGGFIVINPTEALVAIDVNSGRNTEAAALEATALETNLEAAVEVARQIRLRDLAGIIVIDFIDMVEPEHREELVTVFESALTYDRTRIQVSPMSDFGLVAVTRKRMRGGLRQRLTQICPCCSGEGRVKDPVTVGLELERALRRRVDPEHKSPKVRLNPRTRTALEQDPMGLLTSLKKRVGGRLDLERDESLEIGEFEIDAT